jgi:hypothetical protein
MALRRGNSHTSSEMILSKNMCYKDWVESLNCSCVEGDLDLMSLTWRVWDLFIDNPGVLQLWYTYFTLQLGVLLRRRGSMQSLETTIALRGADDICDNWVTKWTKKKEFFVDDVDNVHV